jgi:hypothetical protein
VRVDAAARHEFVDQGGRAGAVAAAGAEAQQAHEVRVPQAREQLKLVGKLRAALQAAAIHDLAAGGRREGPGLTAHAL